LEPKKGDSVEKPLRIKRPEFVGKSPPGPQCLPAQGGKETPHSPKRKSGFREPPLKKELRKQVLETFPSGQELVRGKKSMARVLKKPCT